MNVTHSVDLSDSNATLRPPRAPRAASPAANDMSVDSSAASQVAVEVGDADVDAAVAAEVAADGYEVVHRASLAQFLRGLRLPTPSCSSSDALSEVDIAAALSSRASSPEHEVKAEHDAQTNLYAGLRDPSPLPLICAPTPASRQLTPRPLPAAKTLLEELAATSTRPLLTPERRRDVVLGMAAGISLAVGLGSAAYATRAQWLTPCQLALAPHVAWLQQQAAHLHDGLRGFAHAWQHGAPQLIRDAQGRPLPCQAVVRLDLVPPNWGHA